ncbi:MAG TPA: class II aldolase/adducin family protein [Stellaceae bacterium]|nr:class II aldolase/adducin family protein [Stellaceae bacterium]
MSTVTAFRPPTRAAELTEREARIQLAACYRLIAHFGMDDLVFTHISMRVPGSDGHFLINPYGLMFHEITASSLLKIDYDGNLIEPSPHPMNKAGFIIHSAIHMARHDVACVLHTHTRAGIALSCLETGLLPLNQFSLQFHKRIAYHGYEGIALDLDERQRLIADLGDKSVMILKNHGLLTTGVSIPEAFSLMYYLEQSCRIQLDVMASGAKYILPESEVQDKTLGQYVDNPLGTGQREWPALMRLLDAKDPSYKD